jgi:hypothetical protein
MEHLIASAVEKYFAWLGEHPDAVVAAVGLLFGVPIYVLTRNAELYSNFDTLYQSVLEAALSQGAFRNPRKTLNYQTAFENEDEKAAYEAYAFMVFNVCETIADGLNFYTPKKKGLLELAEGLCCWLLPPSASRTYLRHTWHPVLVAEMQLHGTWLRNQTDGLRFKGKFLTLMKDLKLPQGSERAPRPAQSQTA